MFNRWLCNVLIKVRWGNQLSHFFRLSAGVRQGGILSPAFFCVYIDSVIDIITKLDKGCYVRVFFTGIWLYADDIVLLSASVNDLQQMIDACVFELEKLDLFVNIKKCNCMRIGRRCKAVANNVVINGFPVYWCDQLSYLGVVITSSTVFKVNFHENKANFFRAANCILSRIGSKNISVLLSLFFSKCVPMLIYGACALSLKKYEFSKLDNCLDLFLAKLFRTFNKNILRQCLYFTGYLPVSLHAILIKIKFLKAFYLLENYNSKLFYFFNSVQEDVHLLISVYNIETNDSVGIRKLKMWTYFENSL